MGYRTGYVAYALFFSAAVPMPPRAALAKKTASFEVKIGKGQATPKQKKQLMTKTSKFINISMGCGMH